MVEVVVNLKNRDDDIQHLPVDYQKVDDVLLSDLCFVHQAQKVENEPLRSVPFHCVPGLRM